MQAEEVHVKECALQLVISGADAETHIILPVNEIKGRQLNKKGQTSYRLWTYQKAR